jgi:hypothetical protein
VFGASSRRSERDERRRRFLLPLLLIAPLMLAALLAGWWGGSTFHSQTAPATTVPAGSPAASPAAPSDPIALGPTPSPLPSEEVGGVEVAPSPAPFGSGSGGQTTTIGGADFQITGGALKLMLGATLPIRLTLTNPNSVPIYVTSLSVSVSANSNPPGCSSLTNLRLTQSTVSNDNPVTVPAAGSVTLASPPQAPQITLVNRPDVNQDVCKGKSFSLSYSGSAHS